MLEHRDLRSNASKIKALAPRGGTDGIPPEILEAQEGEVYGVKCVGAFVAAETPHGNAYMRNELAKVMVSRLRPLDEIDAMHDTDTESDVKQLRYAFLTRNANTIPIYWGRTMPPHVTVPVMATMVDSRLRRSAEALAEAAASDAAERERWWGEAVLPTCMGGLGVGGHASMCGARWAASWLSCFPSLVHTCPPLTTAALDSAIAAAAHDAPTSRTPPAPSGRVSQPPSRACSPP